MEYLVWNNLPYQNVCLLDVIENVEPQSNLLRGVLLQKTFPTDALMKMSARHKKDTGLNDDLPNLHDCKVCSKPLVDFLKRRNLKNVEYLPIKIINHKGKVASDEYFIVHPISPQDALDVKASKPKYNQLIKTEINKVENIILDKSRLDPEVKIFRLASYFFPVLIEKELAKEMEAEGFKGPYFEELDEYDK